jgi:UDP-N-acetylmuramate dehydrogenase
MMSAMNTKGHDAPRGKLLLNEPMSGHTSWRAGGPADRFYIPADLDDLAIYIKSLPASEPLYWVGLGSNLLVRDGGLRGTVIMTSGALNGLSQLGDGDIRAEAGVACAKAARFSVSSGLVGGEFLAGIPGTIGGALAMNAGAFGGETWKIVHAVETLNRHGEIRKRPTADYRVSYRHVEGPVNSQGDEWFVAGYFRLSQGEASEAKTLIKSLLAKRGATQPTQLPNAGSVFKNPPNDFAARLIEASGLKGAREGNACVSDLHANFIVNVGGARAADIERLIQRVQAEVECKHGVRLETEVRVIGEAL